MAMRKIMIRYFNATTEVFIMLLYIYVPTVEFRFVFVTVL